MDFPSFPVVPVPKDPMFAREESADESLEIRVSQGDVRSAERGYDLDIVGFKVGSAEDDHQAVAFEAGFAEGIDFVLVQRKEC
jgi:hypothetical protein